MRALPVPPEPLWRTDFRQRIAVSLWFLPTIYAAASIGAANLTIWLDSVVDAPIGVRPDLVSDPGTAIDRISDLLAIAGSRLDPTGLRVDSAGTVRVKRKLRNFDGLLVLSLTEIIRYGADAPQVTRRLRAVLNELEATLPAERQDAIARQRDLLEAAVTSALPAPFTDVSATADREGLG